MDPEDWAGAGKVFEEIRADATALRPDICTG
jgi:hypothetical protein